MYTFIIIVLIGTAFLVFIRGLRSGKFKTQITGVLLGFATVVFFWFLHFWGEMLWFRSLGYNDRFWTAILVQILFTAATAIFCWLLLSILMYFIPPVKKNLKTGLKTTGVLIGAIWGFQKWELFYKFWNAAATDLHDPIFQKETGFYLFTLPFYESIYSLLLILSLIVLAVLFFSTYIRIENENVSLSRINNTGEEQSGLVKAIYASAGFFILVLGFGFYLDRYELMYSELGVVTGPGWTDDIIRIPGYGILLFICFILAAVVLLRPLRRWFQAVLQKAGISSARRQPYTLVSAGGLIFIIWFITLVIVPGLFQWLQVEPNEITFEKPYIENNIRFTQYGFGLNDVEEEYYPASEDFTAEMVEKNQNIFSNIRLWDWRALDSVYEQFQEIRLYYEFADVDIDRYTFNNQYRQVMISAREMKLSNLPRQSRTFVNERFKYTHGYGITLTTVNEFTPEGLPHLLIKDIPPKSEYSELQVKRPQIYYGQLTNTPVITNTDEDELDYPSGEENIYTNYSGKGGVQLTNIWRTFLFGWKFDGTRLFLSNYPHSESRIMFHRNIKKRVEKLVPFLKFDDDPYITLVDGKLYWILDCYTTSGYFPYSEPFTSNEYIEYAESDGRRTMLVSTANHLNGINYIRNSVKAVVDAYNGSVDFYIFEPDDPVIQVWNKIFPDLFKEKEDMPEDIVRHMRYPSDILLVQGLVYAKYHMNDPTVFYNQEDLWIRATEKYYGSIVPVEPYYIMWELPESDNPEFVLILPFTPKNRQVLIGWIAGMCDKDNYGRLLTYKFPKEKRVLGTQQVETKIDQDSYLSGQLTLWDQRGSDVIRGNVLAIPFENTIIYVEPIYLQAETAAYPELRLVAIMHNDNFSYAETFDEALKGLLEKSEGEKIETGMKQERRYSVNELIKGSNEAFENYIKFIGEKKFDDASQSLKTLQEKLQQLMKNVENDN